jgi:ubiquinone/menaquinone biosynthesis C-methylase UbiE
MHPNSDDQAKAIIAEVFGRAASSYGQGSAGYFGVFGKRLVEHVELAHGMKVLDVGTGRGAVLFPAAHAVGSAGFVTGIDISGPMVAATKAELQLRGVANAGVRVLDAEHLDYPDEAFDAVLCGFSLFFLPHTEAALSEFLRVLRPGRKLGVSTWGKEESRWRWYDDLLQRYQPNSEIQPLHTVAAFDQEYKVAAAVIQAGYHLIAVLSETVTFTYPSPEDWWSARWSHFGRLRLERLSDEDFASFKADVWRHITRMYEAGELVSDMEVLYTIAEKN